ncbi:MAG: uracil-DNA glycosylase [Anaerolineaceae bacterium]
MDGLSTLNEIAEEVRSCTKCKLYHSRKLSVPGEGPANAEIMFIGEGPGFHENEQGRPFVGAAGNFLSELLSKIDLKRQDVFIANVVKCRPPSNRDPEPDELLACDMYLERQIEAINPQLIVTLGRFSMGKFLPNVRISDIHGKARWVGNRLVVAMYHPAAALHQPALKSTIIHDFEQLPGYVLESKKKNAPASPEPIHKPAPAAPAKEEEKPHTQDATQLKLF